MVERVVASRVRDPEVAADAVQETLVRVLEALQRGGLDDPEGYAATVALNVVRGTWRQTERSQRLRHRLLSIDVTPDASERLERAQESAAMRDALASLAPDAAAHLHRHELRGASTAELAADSGSTPAAIAQAMARTRARARVAFVLAYRHLELPTERCRPVLEAVSAADVRRLARLDAGEHIGSCPTCGDVAPVLEARSRAMAGLLPFAAGLRSRLARPRTRTAGGAVAAAAVLAVALAVTGGSSPAAPSPTDGAADPIAPASAAPAVATGPAPATPAPSTEPAGTGPQATPGDADTVPGAAPRPAPDAAPTPPTAAPLPSPSPPTGPDAPAGDTPAGNAPVGNAPVGNALILGGPRLGDQVVLDDPLLDPLEPMLCSAFELATTPVRCDAPDGSARISIDRSTIAGLAAAG